jgi:hypothetical protein
MYNRIQIEKDSISAGIIEQVTEVVTTQQETVLSYWFWVALLEFVIIILFIYKTRKKNKILDFSDVSKDKVKSAKTADVDMANLMNSISGAKPLYKSLSRLCHPDRFINTDKQTIAENIFQEISNNKRNYKMLVELKERAIKELEIKIK